MSIDTAPDYLPLTLWAFISHFLNVLYEICFPTKHYQLTYTTRMVEAEKTYHTILGYSCRCLFEVFLKTIDCSNSRFLITPFHHTSWRDLITKYIPPENITIMRLNNMNSVTRLPEMERCDYLIVTHLFGQDIRFDYEALAEFKKRHPKAMFIEDRVQGGTLNNKFSHPLFDVSFYSMGMDKKPVALGGGFFNIRDRALSALPGLIENHHQLPLETESKRFLFLLKKIPTYVLYNYPDALRVLKRLLNALGFDLHEVAQGYRKANPGFSHSDYLYRPSGSLRRSMLQQLREYSAIEDIYDQKSMEFFGSITKLKYFPWYRRRSLHTPYNTISVPDRDTFMSYLKRRGILALRNPTYKIFDFEYEGRVEDQEMNDSLVYLPSLPLLTFSQVKELAAIVDAY